MATNEELPHDDLELVRRIAGQMARSLPRHVERDELISLGNLGLVEARQRFEASRGVPFSAFAGRRIRGAILDGLRKCDPLSRSERAQHRAATAPSSDTVHVASKAQELGTTSTADDVLSARAALKDVQQALDELPPRERQVVHGHFLLEQPLKHIGSELGVSESRVSQILGVALRRLRAALDAPFTMQTSQEAFQ